MILLINRFVKGSAGAQLSSAMLQGQGMQSRVSLPQLGRLHGLGGLGLCSLNCITFVLPLHIWFQTSFFTIVPS